MPIFADNQDAANSVFVSRQLEARKAQLFEVKYAELTARKMFPQDPSEDYSGRNVITYEVMDSVGVAKLISSYADDLPRADVRVVEYRSPVRPIAAAFGYNVDEIKAAQAGNRDLRTKKAAAAIKSTEEQINLIAWKGDPYTNVPGFLTNPNIPSISAADVGGDVNWVDKTGDQILFDLNELFNSINSNTNGVEWADTLGLPPAEFNFVQSKRLGDTEVTVMSFFMRNNRFVQQVEMVPELTTADTTNNGPMAIAYRRDVEVLELVIPDEPTFMEPQKNNLELVVPIHGTCGGVIVYYPLACKFMTGIGPVA